MPAASVALNYKAEFTHSEFEAIARGLVPEAMEDKWFIYLEDDVLYLHRSWTGSCIYQVQFVQEYERHRVSRTIANRNPDECRETDDVYDVKLLNFLIRNLLLGHHLEFPRPNNLPSASPRGLYQHLVSGTGFREKPERRIY